MKRALSILVSIVACACASPVRPEPSALSNASAPELRDSDLAVIAVALEGVISAEYRDAQALQNLQAVTPDRTLRACDPPEFQMEQCINPNDLRSTEWAMTELFGQSGRATLWRNNRVSSRILGPIRGARLIRANEFFSRQPLADEFNISKRFARIVMFSTPMYPSPRDSLIYVLHVNSAAAVVQLVRARADWTVRSVRMLWIS